MKTVIQIILTILLTKTVSGQADPTSLWIFRMEQYAKESNLYEKLNGNRDGFTKSAGLLTQNDTLKYSSGQIFRMCEVSESMLNGHYNIYYPSGQPYLISTYKKNVLTDSAIMYNDKGKIEFIIRYLEPQKEQQIYFDNNNKIKRIDNIENIPTTSVTFKSGYVHTNSEKGITTEYFNTEGQKIKKKEYYKLYPDEQK